MLNSLGSVISMGGEGKSLESLLHLTIFSLSVQLSLFVSCPVGEVVGDGEFGNVLISRAGERASVSLKEE